MKRKIILSSIISLLLLGGCSFNGVENISLNTNDISININETYKLKATITPSDAVNQEITWSVLNPEIASVDAIGTVTGLSIGETTIFCEVQQYGKKASCRVKVSEKSISPTKIEIRGIPFNNEIELNYLYTLVPVFEPSGVTETDLVFSFSNDKIKIYQNTSPYMIFATSLGLCQMTVSSQNKPDVKIDIPLKIIENKNPECLVIDSLNEYTNYKIGFVNTSRKDLMYLSLSFTCDKINLTTKGQSEACIFNTIFSSDYKRFAINCPMALDTGGYIALDNFDSGEIKFTKSLSEALFFEYEYNSIIKSFVTKINGASYFLGNMGDDDVFLLNYNSFVKDSILDQSINPLRFYNENSPTDPQKSEPEPLIGYTLRRIETNYAADMSIKYINVKVYVKQFISSKYGTFVGKDSENSEFDYYIVGATKNEDSLIWNGSSRYKFNNPIDFTINEGTKYITEGSYIYMNLVYSRDYIDQSLPYPSFCGVVTTYEAIYPDEINFSVSQNFLPADCSFDYNLSFTPRNQNQPYVFLTSNPDVAYYDAILDKIVTKTEGNATLTVRSSTKSEIYSSINIEVYDVSPIYGEQTGTFVDLPENDEFKNYTYDISFDNLPNKKFFLSSRCSAIKRMSWNSSCFVSMINSNDYDRIKIEVPNHPFYDLKITFRNNLFNKSRVEFYYLNEEDQEENARSPLLIPTPDKTIINEVIETEFSLPSYSGTSTIILKVFSLEEVTSYLGIESITFGFDE